MATGVEQGVCGQAQPGAVERALGVLTGKWTTLLVRELMCGPLRFGELRTALGSPSAKTLTDRLRALEYEGVLTRTLYPEIPPRVEYELTERGRALWPVLVALHDWGSELAG
ncbi:winged helix-turn-helix transcriptional regulator [Crossiella sp. NPDC003009]